MLQVPYFRPQIGESEIAAVVECLRSGWLTTGPVTRRFEQAFCEATGAQHAVAVNSCTAALHLAVEALGLQPGQAVLVPTMTFAASAEIVAYRGAVPLLVDCDPVTGNLDLADAERKIEQLRGGKLPDCIDPSAPVVGLIAMHYGGLMLDMQAVRAFCQRHGLWVVEDAAHAFPAAWRADASHPWQRCGENSSAVTCFSFYANKTMTTGEGGMAVTDDADLAARMRAMSLHGLSHDAWRRYSGGAWDYRIMDSGFKYNLTDIASAIGIHQLARAESMRQERARLAAQYREALADCEWLELPEEVPDRIQAWHLFPLRLKLERLTVDRNDFLQQLKDLGVGCSVHWRPLHLHPLYEEKIGWQASLLPVATRQWQRLISLPLFSGMTSEEFSHVVASLQALGARLARRTPRAATLAP